MTAVVFLMMNMDVKYSFWVNVCAFVTACTVMGIAWNDLHDKEVRKKERKRKRIKIYRNAEHREQRIKRRREYKEKNECNSPPI